MLFLQQLRGELRKLFARPRTWMGYGAFLVMKPKMKVFAAFPEWSEGALRLGLCAAGIGLSMITLSSIAFMFSCFKIKPAAATIITLSILFVDMILQNSSSSNPTKRGSSLGR